MSGTFYKDKGYPPSEIDGNLHGILVAKEREKLWL
jgi:hypothetical protein